MAIDEDEEIVELFGRGISLDERRREEGDISWDLQISDDGDVKLDRGTSELEKDLAFKIATALDVARGAVLEPRVLTAMKNRVRTVCEDDERVRIVTDVAIERTDEDPDSLEIRVRLQTIGDLDITLSTQL